MSNASDVDIEEKFVSLLDGKSALDQEIVLRVIERCGTPLEQRLAHELLNELIGP
jgi:hypothetical protein